MYSVKSAYRKLTSAHQQQTLESSGDEFWKKTWRLNVPPEVKVFCWRVLHEFLPAKSVLHRRHIEPTAFCEVCGADSESIRHVLIECTIAKSFWQEVKILTGLKLPNLHSHTWASDILLPECCTDKERSIFIIGMYSLWMQRNKRRHGEDPSPIKVCWAVDMAHDLLEIVKPKEKANLSLCKTCLEASSDRLDQM